MEPTQPQQTEEARRSLEEQRDIDMVRPMLDSICHRTQANKPICVGVAGGTGSGKTTLVSELEKALGVGKICVLSHDQYYKDISHLPLEEREKTNFDHPHSLDTALLVEHIRALKQGKAVQVPTYDFTTHSRNKTTSTVEPRPIIIVEGILVFAEPELVHEMQIRIFVDTDSDIRLVRRIARDAVQRGRSLQSVLDQYLNTVRVMHLQFVEPSKRHADIIIPLGFNAVALDLLTSRLKTSLEATN
eukprot:c9247_g1_i1.p1 GENE.c9247_g1_i1~~c9247_g1_i1.p1  ORF type:complete len:271 (+),score=66.53 c9247_g1_i1:80-814(+)